MEDLRNGDDNDKDDSSSSSSSDSDSDDEDEYESNMSPEEREASLMGYEGTFDDFNDRVVQFGYLVLFAPAYPLAPFLAFINNILEIRFGGYKMCNGFKRPVWKQRQTIGSWLGMLTILGFAAVVTNAAMVCFVGSRMSELSDLGYALSDDAGQWNITMLDQSANATKPWGTFVSRLQHAQLWWRFVIMEHLVMLGRVVIISIAPTVPDWVVQARNTLHYRQSEVYLTSDQLEHKLEGVNFGVITRFVVCLLEC
eukprot:SAG31_NODE_8403_length_1458_cov_1.565121_2_plen_254_part_00